MHRYDEDKIILKKHMDKMEKNYNTISNMRLIVSVLTIMLFGFSIYSKDRIYFFLLICSALIFVVLLVIHDKIRVKKGYLEAKWRVIEKRHCRVNGTWKEFEETGLVFLSEDSHVERNLDILGNNSLYQYLCVANTQEGKRKLASYLTNGTQEVELIYERQEAIKELMEKKDFSLELEILSSFFNKQKDNQKDNQEDKWYHGFLHYLKTEDRLLSHVVNLYSFLLPIISVVALFLAIKGLIKVEIPSLLVVGQALIAYYVSGKNRRVTKEVFRFCLSIKDYYKIIKHIEQSKFNSTYLKSLQDKFMGQKGISKGIVKLDHLNEAFVVQSNVYIHFLLQLFTMYDIHCIRFLETWKRRYASDMQEVFKIIGEFEALLSLSMIGVEGNVSFPEIVESDRIYFAGKNMTHPLIDKNKVVPNSLYTSNGIEIITGSNMSGKTTFMRTIGINVVLAYAGAPVRAEYMKLSRLKIFTSMRVMDDVTKGISSFYAEVLRIKEMIEYSKKGRPMLVLIDEIFKGTNSTDRIVGAKEILKSLDKKHIMALVSTHDFELCKLIEGNEINGHNHHFEEYYEEDKICFDFKIKEGKCKTTNAKYILKMAGLIQ